MVILDIMYSPMKVMIGPMVSQGLNPVLLTSAPLAIAVIIIPATIAKEYSPASIVVIWRIPIANMLE